jgi:hypothetical protein
MVIAALGAADADMDGDDQTPPVDVCELRGRIARVEQRQADRTVPEMPSVVSGPVYKSSLSSPPLAFC